ncbi:GGDEF domain-containing protein [bacterium]|nr:MAG: GGDEF domain-containing protein [bacterium]
MANEHSERRRTLEIDVMSQRPTQAILTSTSAVDTGRMYILDPDKVATLGRAEDSTIVFPDASVSGKHARLAVLAGAWVLADNHSTNGTFVNNERITAPRTLQNGDVIRLGPRIMMRFQLMAEDEREALRRMYEAAVYDRLTQLYNRNHLDDRLDAELAFANRHRTELSIALLDVDRFKAVNDTHGHLAGDAVLQSVAQIVGKAVRAEDLVARFGGEEFIVLMRGVPAAGAFVAAERIRKHILATEVPWVVADSATGVTSTIPLQVTVSVGVVSLAECPLKEKVTFLQIADRRLYRAKAEGRNRTIADG